MQIKRTMELTRKQNDQLKQLKEMNKLHKLQEKCEHFKKGLENLITERSDCLNKHEVLLERITSVQEDLKNARKEEYNWQRKLESANQSQVADKTDDLQSICVILGYHISKCQMIKNNGIQLTLCYLDICHVTYNEIAQVFDVIEIFPQHPNFLQIKEFLQNSQDLKGLLSCLRKFFDFAIECKEKQKQK